jgi:signal transduction histidine kinase
MVQQPSQPILRGTRLVLALGYGGLLGLLVFLGLYAARTLSSVRRTDAQSSRLYIERSDRLEAILSRAYSASGRVRDYLLDPDPGSTANHRQKAHQEWAETLAAVAEYKRVAAESRKQVIEMLANDMSRYWAVAGQSLELRGDQRIRKGYEVLTGQLVPLRDRWLATLNELRVFDQRDLHNSISEAATKLEGLEQRLRMVVVVSVLLGVFLAAGTWRYLARLERAAQAQYNASVEFASRLEELSQRVLGVQEDERRKLARELHDEVGQTLGALLVDLGQASGALAPASGEAADRLRSAHRLAESALSTVRNMTLLLRPSMLDDLGLVPALYWQARETSRRTGMDVRVTAEEEELDLPDPLRTTIYRVVQEALQNAARHSRAGSVEIVIQPGDGGLRILIRDDGQGFDPKRTKGIGLLGMQERVSQLGGEMVVESAPGHGTLLKVQLPLEYAEGETRISA